MPDLNASPEEAAFFESRGETVAESLRTVPDNLPPKEEAPAPAPIADEKGPEPKDLTPPKDPAEPATAPKAKEEDAPSDRRVPLSAMLEERNKRKEMGDALKAAQEELARLRQGAPQPQAQQQEEGLDPLADIESLKQWKANQERQTREQQELTQFSNHVMAKEHEYVAANPEYPQAIEFLKNAREQEMRVLGLNDQQIALSLANEARQTAAYALQTEQNPAELFHALAKQRGFQVKAPEAPAAPVPPAPAAMERLANLRKGHQASKSVASGGGGAPDSAPSLSAIAQMEGEAFDAMWKNGSVKRLFG